MSTGTRDYERFTRRRMSITVGDDVSDVTGFSAGTYGALRPHAIAGQAIALLAVTVGDSCRLALKDATQFDGKTSVRIQIQEWPTDIALAWSGANSRYQSTIAGLQAFLQARLGRQLRCSVEPL